MAAVLKHRNLPLLLLRAREGVMSQFRGILNQHGLTEQQWRILRALLENSAMEPRQICEVCQLLSPSVAGVLARMEELGLVKRERMANDQRRVRVSVTPKSRALARRMAPLIEARYAELEAALGPQLMAQTYDLLDRVLERLGAANQGVAATDPEPQDAEPQEAAPQETGPHDAEPQDTDVNMLGARKARSFAG